MTRQPGAPPPSVPGQPQQVVWMQRPQLIPGCPPGLEYLTQIDQLLVKQQFEILESLYIAKNLLFFILGDRTAYKQFLHCEASRNFLNTSMFLKWATNGDVIELCREAKKLSTMWLAAATE